VLDGSMASREGEICTPLRQNVQLQIAAKPSVLCCHLANTNEELGGLATAIPSSCNCVATVIQVISHVLPRAEPN